MKSIFGLLNIISLIIILLGVLPEREQGLIMA